MSVKLFRNLEIISYDPKPQSFEIGEPLSDFVDRIVREANEKREKELPVATEAKLSTVRGKSLVGRAAMELPAPKEKEDKESFVMVEKLQDKQKCKEPRITRIEQQFRNLGFLEEQICFQLERGNDTITQGLKEGHDRLFLQLKQDMLPPSAVDAARAAGV